LGWLEGVARGFFGVVQPPHANPVELPLSLHDDDDDNVWCKMIFDAVIV